MKKQLSILLALVLLLGLTACGEPQGITITNNLGVDLITLEVLDANEEGVILPAGISAGGSDIIHLKLDGGEGYMDLFAEDSAQNSYRFDQVYLIDGVDVTLCAAADAIWVAYSYNGEDRRYDGQFTAAAPGDVLRGEWHYSDQADILTFDGDGGYTWQTANGTETGRYTFDGEWVSFTAESSFVIGWSRASIGAEGHLFVEGDAGSYYVKQTD